MYMCGGKDPISTSKEMSLLTKISSPHSGLHPQTCYWSSMLVDSSARMRGKGVRNHRTGEWTRIFKSVRTLCFSIHDDRAPLGAT